VSSIWPKIPLGDLLEKSDRWIRIQPKETYKLITVRLWGKGVNLRGQVTGAEIAASEMLQVQPNQFILSRIDARNGASGLIPEFLKGAVVTNDFPVYDIDTIRLHPAYLGWMSKTRDFVDFCRAASEGTTNRVRLKEGRFLTTAIKLPPMEDQRRIVAKIDELASKIEEARSLRQEVAHETDGLVLSWLSELFVTGSANWETMPMERAIEITDKQVNPTLPEYSQLPHISGENMESETCRLLPWRTAAGDGVRSNNYLFTPGTILYSKIRPYLRKAVFIDFKGVCSADVYPIRVISPEINPNFLKWTLVAEPFTNYANQLSGQTRMPKLNRKQLFGFPFAHPSLAEQGRIVTELEAFQAEVERLRQLQTATTTEIEALLPSILDKAFKGEL
jgi:type I restriction enzyme S subunit